MSTIGDMTSYRLPRGYNLGGGIGSDKNDVFGKLIKDSKAEAVKTPVERARDAVLEKHGISNEQYDGLPTSERDAIDKEIAEAAKKVAQAMTNRTSIGNAGVGFA